MKIRRKKKVDPFIQFLQQRPSVSIKDRERALDYLVSFVRLIRPRTNDPEEAVRNIGRVLHFLQEQPIVVSELRTAILAQLINSNLLPMLTESGVTVSRGVGRELHARFKHKFLPPVQDPNDFLYLLDRIFYRHQDYVWVEAIGHARWVQFFEALGLSVHGREPVITRQALVALQVLSAGVAQLGWENAIVKNAPFKEQREENPFAVQQYLIYELKILLSREGETDPAELRTLLQRIYTVLDQDQQVVQYIRDQTAEKGASLSQTYILFQIEQKLERMQLVLDIVDGDQQMDTSRLATLFIRVIRYENRKNSIFEFLSQTTGYLAYQIAEHKTKKGTKYITSSPLEYWQMIFSAMGGGLIVCFVAIFKILLGKLHMAPFWHGFTYSVNYSVGFVAIEETKTTLATKQPAFTASAVASSLDTRKGDDTPNLYNLAVTVSKVSRSQMASFIGNLIIVWPVTFVLAWLYDLCFGKPLVAGDAAMKLIDGQHPWHSLSLLYACNTGVFLFLSGLIAGYVQNKMNYGRIARRITEHPILRQAVPRTRLERIANYLDGHAGSLAGNISLGFFLGMASTVGDLFGIGFDIRHITIAAANSSIGLYGVGWNNVSFSYMAVVVIGILGIGFFNFMVSFALAFIVAVRSRGVKLRDYPEFLSILWKYFRSHPLDFFRPRKRLQPDAA